VYLILYSKAGLGISKTDDILFVSLEVYNWMLLDEFAISAYWIAQLHEAKTALMKILKEKKYNLSH